MLGPKEDLLDSILGKILRNDIDEGKRNSEKQKSIAQSLIVFFLFIIINDYNIMNESPSMKLSFLSIFKLIAQKINFLKNVEVMFSCVTKNS